MTAPVSAPGSGSRRLAAQAGRTAALLAALWPAWLGAQTTSEPPASATPPNEPAVVAPAEAVTPPVVPSSPAVTPPAETGAPAATEPAPATPPAAPATAPPAPPAGPPAPPRITFDLKFPPERGGGAVVGSAENLETRGETEIVASGMVELKYQDIVMKADRLVLDRQTQQAEAEGHVTIDQGPRRMTGDTAIFDLGTKTGRMTAATAFVDPDYYFQGEEIAKVGENSYTVVKGTFTSCKGDPTPDWSFHLARARVDVGGYAHIKHPSLFVKRMPVFYLPYILWPAKTERASGLLVPGIGYSKRHGAYLGISYYQVLGPSWDTTFLADGYGKNFLGFGNEVRYHPTEGTKGTTQAYVIRDPDQELWRWKVDWSHESNDLPWGLRGVVSYEDYSDFEFFREFERNLDENTRRDIYSRAFLTGNWGPHSLNVLFDKRETFVDAGNVFLFEQTPEIEYRLRNLKLGKSPFYLSVLSTSSFLRNERSETFKASYGRLDLAPDLTLPLRAFPWLSISLSGGGRGTWYGNRLPEVRTVAGSLPGTTRTALFCGDREVGSSQLYCDDTFTRFFPTASAGIVGPSFSRVYEKPIGSFAKLKHIIEPRWTYNYLGDFDHPESVPLFDEVDGFRSRNAGTFALVNRVLAKPKDEKDSAREIFSLELSQAYSFDNDQPLQRSSDGRTSQEGPWQGLLRFYPSRTTSLQAQASYDTLDRGLESTALTASLGLHGNQVGLTWFTRYNVVTGDKLSDQARLNTGLSVVPQRLRLEAQVAYDLEARELQQQRYTLVYTSQCWGVRLEAQEFRRTVALGVQQRDRNYRLSLTLKNVGTFLDLTGGQSNQP